MFNLFVAVERRSDKVAASETHLISNPLAVDLELVLSILNVAKYFTCRSELP